MPKQQPNLYYACKLKPKDAIKYFESKGFNISWDWYDTWQEAHAKAFTVAKMTQLDLLQDTKKIVQKALDEGWTEQQFIKEATPILKARGWWGKEIIQNKDGSEKMIQKGSAHRLKTIYKTNIQTSYMAGRYKQQLENIDIEPYWQYVAVLDSRTRPEHRELHGKIFKYDDKFWDYFYPPNGWGCRCRVRAFDKDHLEKNKLKPENSDGKLSTSYKVISKETGEARQVGAFKTTDLSGKTIKVKTDAGWSYNVGKAAFQPDLESYDYDVATQYVKGIVTGPPFELFSKQAQDKAAWAINTVKADNINIRETRDLAVKHMRKNISRNERGLFHYVATLNQEKKTLIKANKQAVKLSLDSFIKNYINHPEITPDEYRLIPEIVDKTELLIYSNAKNEQIFCFADKGNYYKTTIKTTGNKDENYLQSFHPISAKGIKKDKKRKGIKVIFDKLPLE